MVEVSLIDLLSLTNWMSWAFPSHSRPRSHAHQRHTAALWSCHHPWSVPCQSRAQGFLPQQRMASLVMTVIHNELQMQAEKLACSMRTKLNALERLNKGAQLSRKCCQAGSWQGSCKGVERSQNIQGSSSFCSLCGSHSNLKELNLEITDGAIFHEVYTGNITRYTNMQTPQSNRRSWPQIKTLVEKCLSAYLKSQCLQHTRFTAGIVCCK